MNIFDKTCLLMLIIVIGTGLSCVIKKWNSGYSSDGDDYWM